MATYDLQEQEQIDEIKTWWKMHGGLVLNVLSVLLVIVVAWQAWAWYQRSQSTQAAAVFSVLQKAAQNNEAQHLKEATGELLEKFPSTRYAALGAMISTKALLGAGDTKTAKLQLEWLQNKGSDEWRDLARLRLAAVLLDEKTYDQALKTLDGAVGEGFAARFSDLRGDIYWAQDKKTEAASAYQMALSKRAAGAENAAQSNAVYREIVQMKLDSLGELK